MGSQSRLSLVPATRTGRHHRYLTSTTACWLISRCIIIGHSPLRACPPQTGCTPAFPLGSLDAIFFTAWLAERTSARLLQECHCAPVTAHETANVSELLDMAGRIWRIPSCARSPAFLSGIFQCAFCLPVSYPHTRHERIPGRDHLSRKSSSHKVLTEKHVLRGY